MQFSEPTPDEGEEIHVDVPLLVNYRSRSLNKEYPRYTGKSIFGFTLINPLSNRCQSWRGLMLMVDIVYILMAQPVFDALRLPLVKFDFMGVFNVFVGMLLLIDPFFKLSTDVIEVVDYERRLIANGVVIAKNYISQPVFYTDVLAGTAAIPQLLALSVSIFGRSSPSLGLVMWICRLMRYPRGLLLVGQIFNSGLTTSFGLQIEISLAYTLNSIFITVIMVNLMAAMWYAVGIIHGVHDGWLQVQDLSRAPLWERYLHAVYFSLTTMTTVGYGDAHPTNAEETLAAMVIQIAGAFFFSFVVGNVLNLIQSISRQAQEANKFREKMAEVEVWMDQGGLPEPLQMGIQAYYRDVWSKQASSSEASFLQEMPHSLRKPIILHKLNRITQQLALLSQAPGKARDYILCNGKPIEVPPGHEICREGEDVECIWVLSQGRVRETCIIEELEDWVENSPAVLGESAILADFFDECKTRPCSLLAETRCYLFEVPLQEIRTVAAAFPDLYSHLVQGMGNDLEIKVLEHRMGSNFLERAQATAKRMQHAAPEQSDPTE